MRAVLANLANFRIRIVNTVVIKLNRKLFVLSMHNVTKKCNIDSNVVFSMAFVKLL